MRRRALAVLVVLSALVIPTHGAAASVLPAARSTAYGADISWPNCPQGLGIASRRTLGMPMPTSAARFVVLGLTNGPAFTPNPCLASQVAWVKARHLWAGAYAVVSYPTAAQVTRHGGRGTPAQRLYRTGFAEASYTVGVMRRAGLRAPMVWVDVEPVKGVPWSKKTAANNALLDGVLAGYKAAGVRTGWYSYAYGWKQITGGRRSSLATWVPSGKDTRASALARCGQRSFSGGPVWLAQWTAAGRDHNVTCANVTRRTVFSGMFAST